MSNVNILEVDKQYPELAGPQEIKFDMADSFGVLNLRLHHPMEEEISGFKAECPLEIRFTELYGVIYMLFKFQGMPWMDAPYSIHLSPNLTHLDMPNDGEGYFVLLILADTDGTVRAIRVVSLSTEFSRSLRKAMLQQLDEPFDLPAYDKKIAETYTRYSSRDLVSFSTEYCRF